jgi:hypothetical protein
MTVVFCVLQLMSTLLFSLPFLEAPAVLQHQITPEGVSEDVSSGRGLLTWMQIHERASTVSTQRLRSSKARGLLRHRYSVLRLLTSKDQRRYAPNMSDVTTAA